MMSTDNVLKKSREIITFNILGIGSMQLGKAYAFKDNLELLTQVRHLVMADEEGEEVRPDAEGFYDKLVSGKTYTILDESMIADNSSDHVHTKENELGERILVMEEARRKLIEQYYERKHPYLFKLKENEEKQLAESFRKAANAGNKEELIKVLKKETQTGIYTFDLFTLQFCKDLIEEIENFQGSGLPVLRPNTMNRYGLVLNEIGFRDFFDDLLARYVRPIASMLYGELGEKLNSHHTFVVQYKQTEDKALNFHYDDCDVTINVCLGKEFTGGTLYFRGLVEDESTQDENFEFSHVKGRAMIHRGHHRHGANSIKSGERYNLIMWCRGSK
eukprot:TRINITY_DN3981_c0_g1_i1.p1 TRINITY_DN3981_c0_g1~~TRINITY_DN3981_c0_g1_i1.p1  ORF type:complete len:332 (+),score=65.84 TRINITY_DN3981_c0_g1_i1:115-1110(+)